MKKILLAFALIATSIIHGNAQDSVKYSPLSGLLNQYYQLKNALVDGKTTLASTHATSFLKIANSIDYKVISEGNINTLLKDATLISESGNIKKQKELFSSLSSNMIILAKSMKLGEQPVYEMYCPMKKAGWLSDQKAVKNPYYGSAMLTCGEVVEIY